MSYIYSFQNDYSEGAHPDILAALQNTNLIQDFGYGEDSYCAQASELIKNTIQNQNAAIHFVSAGTQTNLLCLASLLKPYESVIAATTAHISTHEAGAIEATGHKINEIEAINGKITVEQITRVIDTHTDEHMVKPKVVFLSFSTELGTIYTKQELQNISRLCKEKNLYLYIDGARLASGLMASTCDITLPEVTELADMFYIGGTKNGALFGEAIVISNQSLQQNFRFHMKQRGALLAKGRILGIQFLTLFQQNLYFELAKHANAMATKLKTGLLQKGYQMQGDSPTNQIFPIFPNTLITTLQQSYGFYTWNPIDTTTSAVRLVTSWATKEERVDAFLAAVPPLL